MFPSTFPMMVERRCPAWKGFAMLGEEYSRRTLGAAEAEEPKEEEKGGCSWLPLLVVVPHSPYLSPS